MKTHFSTKEEAAAQRKWLLINAENQVVGRLASQIAGILRGKTKPGFNSHNDMGDFVVVINAEKIRFTGAKEEKKIYYRHTGYAGGVKMHTPASLRKSKPEQILEHAVKGMLPHNSLGRAQLKKLKIFSGAEHEHQAQKPEVFEPVRFN